jgi:retron-type reverse transcriptase
MTVKALIPVRTLNLVMPLAQKATDMRSTETAEQSLGMSGAISTLIGSDLRRGDVKSIQRRSTQTATLGFRTSTTAIRTTTTSLPSAAAVSSAETNLPTFDQLVQAYLDCRKSKRNSSSCRAFEDHLERNLCDVYEELISGKYQPSRSICFVITQPKPREVWAAEFKDRVVHHLLYNHISPRFYASFIANSCACIPTRGTLYAAERLEHSVRSITQNWSKSAHYLKMDLSNFFVAIDKNVLREQLAMRVIEPWWMNLTESILFHDPRLNVEVRGNGKTLALVPPHKSLFNAPDHCGLPIGNLSSQFFANVYLDALDQYCKHKIGAKHYVRYVDDFIILHESAEWLNDALRRITEWLPLRLGANLNPRKTILQPIHRGIDFVGHVIKPWRRTTRKRTIRTALSRIRSISDDETFETGNSYLGLFGQASHSHSDRAQIANALRLRGHSVQQDLTKIFRK